MLPKCFVVNNSHNIVLISRVFPVQVLQYLQLHTRLVLKSGFASDNFDRNDIAQLMVEAFDRLSERPTPQSVQHFIPIPDVVFHHNFIVTSVIIVAKIVLFLSRSIYLGRTAPQVVNQCITLDFDRLVISQFTCLLKQCLVARHRKRINLSNGTRGLLWV